MIRSLQTSTRSRPITPGRFPIVRYLWHSTGLFPVWVGFIVVVTVVEFVVSLFRDIEISGWVIAGFVPPWFLFGMGLYLTSVYLPLFVAHGITRRRFLSQAMGYGVALVTVSAALMTLGFALERLLYHAAGWTQEFTDDFTGLYTAADQYGMIFLSYLLIFPIYLAIGAAIGAAFYRKAWGGLGGLLLIVLGLGLITPAALAGASNMPPGPVIDWLAGDLATPAVITACVVSATMATTIAWTLARDLPIRTTSP